MKIRSIASTNLLRFVRDRSNIFFVFVLPLGLVLLIGAQFGHGFAPTIGVVPGSGDLSDAIVMNLEAQEDVTIKEYDDEDVLLLAVERGGLAAGVVIPADLDDQVAGGAQVKIGFVSRPDGFGPQMQTVVAEAVAVASNPVDAARFVEARGVDPATAQSAVSQAGSQVSDIAVTAETAGESLFPANLGRFDIGASSQLVLFMFLTGLSGSAAVIQTRSYGVATRMIGTPTSVATIVAGEALGRFVIVLVQGLYIMFASLLVFQVNWGDPLGAAAVLVAFAAVGAGAALLFGTLFSNDQQAGGIGVIAGLGLAALGGSMLPLELFGDTMRTISRLTPHAWANDAFAELTRRDGTIADILPQLGVLGAFAIVLLALAAWRMQTVITKAF